MIKFQILNSTSLVPLIVMPAQVHADPITAMLGAMLGGGKVALGIAGFLTNTLASLAFSAVSALLAKKNQSSGGLTTNQVMQGEGNAQRIILGRYATAGNDVAPWYSYGSGSKTPNDRLVYIRAWADHPIDGVDYFIIDGKDHTFNPATGDIANLNGKAWVRSNHDGRQVAADAWLQSKFDTHADRPWTSNHKLIGVSYSALEFAFDQQAFPNYPEIKAVLRGMRLYDPRKDSTVPGGSGSHRWTDQSTHEWSSNPIIAVYNIIRGLRLPGGVVYGIGAGAADIPLSSLFAAANQCDLAGDDPSSTDIFGDTKRYQFGLDFGIDTPALDVIGEILASCGGKMAEVGGQYYFSVGSPDLAVASITDGDVLLDHNMDESPFLPLASRHNYISAQYPDPKNAFAETTAVPIANSIWEIEDDNRRLGVDLKLSSVPFAAQVRRIMRTSIADHRRQRIHTITLGPWAAGIKPLRNITWTSPAKGYASKLFEVQGVNIDAATLNTTLNIRERDPEDFNPDAISDAIAPNYPNRDQSSNIIESVGGFTATATTIKDANGVDRRPAIKIQWAAMPDGIADGIAYEIRLADNKLVLVGSTDDIARGEHVISESILPETEYRVYAKIIASNYVTAFGAFASLITDPVFLQNVDLGGVNVKTLISDAGMSVPELGAGLPTSGMVNDDLYFNTTDNKMYRFDDAANAWVPLVGDLLNGSVDATKLASSIVPPLNWTGTLPATRQGSDVLFRTDDAKLYRWDGMAYTSSFESDDLTGIIAASHLGLGVSKYDRISLRSRGSGSGVLYYFRINGELITAATGRGISIAIFDRTTHALLWRGPFDLYGSNAAQNILLGDKLDEYADPNHLLLLINGDNCGAGLSEANKIRLRARGGSYLVDRVASNSPYCFIGYPGLVEGQALEAWQPFSQVGNAPLDLGTIWADADVHGVGGASLPSAAYPIGSTVIGDGAIVSPKIAANAIIAEHMSVDSVTAGAVAAGAINTRELAARAVTASRMLISNENLVSNATFLTGDLTDWDQLRNNDNPPAVYITPGNAAWGETNVLWYNGGRHTSGQNIEIISSQWIAVTPGDQYSISVKARRDGNVIGRLQLVQRTWADVDSWPILITLTSGANLPDTNVHTITTTYTVPAGVNRIRPFMHYPPATNTAGMNLGVTDIRIVRKADANLIVNGAIQTDHMTANTINANRLIGGTVTAGLLASSGLITNSAQINTGLINNGHISGAIQSTNFVSGSAGWQINKTGTAQFNNLIVRGSLVVGSVSDVEQVTLPNEFSRHQMTWTSAGAVTLPAVSATDMWFIHASASIRAAQGWVPPGAGESGYTTIKPTGFRLMRRYQIDGTWQGWVQVGSVFSGNSLTAWGPVAFNEVMAGEYTSVQYQIETNLGGTGGAPITNINARRLALVARKITR